MIATKLLKFGPVFALAFSGKTLAQKQVVPKVNDQICINGYIMDSYCIDLGVLFEDRSVRTLSAEGPTQHSVHCLIDVQQCYTSPFEVLNELEDGSFGRYWRLESNDMLIAYAKANGGCSMCDQPGGTEGAISNGLRLTLTATVVDMGDASTPPTISVLDMNDISAHEEFNTVCGNATKFVPPGVVTTGGSLTTPMLIHGSLMLIGWGFLLPSGAIIAAFGKHRPNAWWFKVHRVIQPVGLIFAIVGWIVALRSFTALEGKGSLNYDHAVLGMTTMVIGLIQPVNAIFRPHTPKEGEEKTTLRRLWEICHKGLGWVGIILAIVTIGIGTTLLAEENHRRIFQIVYGACICTLLVVLAAFLNIEKKKFG